MSSTSSKPILDGVIAIDKAPAISSAQVIRDVQQHFNPSRLFAPWLEKERARRDAESHNQKRKRKWRGRRDTEVKMGHGGTLDPMATGVLILGIGSGTKQLHYFSTECTKTYETVLLFGAATDSYDTEGKIVGRRFFDHVTKEMVEEKLATFRGKSMQKPPIFSAIRVQGKRLYEYAREGKEVPIEIKERPVEVHELEMTEWMPGGTHKWNWPEKEAEQEEKRFAVRALQLAESKASELPAADSTMDQNAKRKRDDESSADHPLEETISKRTKVNESAPLIEPVAATDALIDTAESQATSSPSQKTEVAVQPNEAEDLVEAGPQSEPTSATVRPACPAPACRIRMKVTSGFYVRSLCHDLGTAVGSLGIMAALVRTQQGDFELGTNVLQYEDLKQGEDTWGPKVQQMLQNWHDNHSSPGRES